MGNAETDIHNMEAIHTHEVQMLQEREQISKENEQKVL